VPAVLWLRVDASICATEPNAPAPHGDLARWPRKSRSTAFGAEE